MSGGSGVGVVWFRMGGKPIQEYGAEEICGIARGWQVIPAFRVHPGGSTCVHLEALEIAQNGVCHRHGIEWFQVPGVDGMLKRGYERLHGTVTLLHQVSSFFMFIAEQQCLYLFHCDNEQVLPLGEETEEGLQKSSECVPKGVASVAATCERGFDEHADLVIQLIYDGKEKVFFLFEVVVDGAFAELSAVGDFFYRCISEPFFREDGTRGFEHGLSAKHTFALAPG